jgi:hypothetical protein
VGFLVSGLDSIHAEHCSFMDKRVDAQNEFFVSAQIPVDGQKQEA